MSEPVRIFINSKPVDAHPDETVLDAITRWDPAIAETLRDGKRSLADNRGLVTGLDTRVYGGAIFRLVSNKQLRDPDNPSASPIPASDG